MKSQQKIVLASESPRRAELLRNAGINPLVMPSPYEEQPIPGLKPEEVAKKHAFEKAKAIADVLEEGIVVAADTVVSIDGEIIEKPNDREHAKEIIQRQQGREFDVISGICIIDENRNRIVNTYETTKVKFYAMDEEEIEWYLDTEEWKDKSGAFAAQGFGSRFIESVNGDFLSVVGLPIHKIYKTLKNWGYANEI